MLVIASAQSAVQSDHCQRNYHHREHHMSAQDREINRSRPALPEKQDIPALVMKKDVAGQKNGGGDHRRDHAESMGPHASFSNQDASSEQQGSARPVKSSVQSREVGVLLGDHAAGPVVQRFTIRKASPNMSNENSTSVAMEELSGKLVSAPEYRSPRSASTP